MTAPERQIAILCASRVSVYHSIPGILVFDQDHDARLWQGGSPCIAHPPCRAWSTFTRHQAKPALAEKELGLWCAHMVQTHGGILEQPAHSHLFKAAGLPLPGWTHNKDSWSIEVCQAWWGYPMLKKTWLFFRFISPLDVHIPIRLHPHGYDRRREQLMSKNQRAATTQAFALWLIQTARMANLPPPSTLTSPEIASLIQS